jgi:DUF1680 family protein
LPEKSLIKAYPFEEGILEDVVKIEIPAKKVSGGEVQGSKLIMIPYYAWDNRVDGTMMVCFLQKKRW